MKKSPFILLCIMVLFTGSALYAGNPGAEAGKAFQKLVGRYSSKKVATQLWDEVSANYSAPTRFYHTLEHIDNFYTQLKKCRSQVADWEVLVIAACYHDVIYGSEDHRDEERSAELAVVRLKAAGLPQEKISKIETLILATKAHALSTENDINLFNDADMSIVGLDREYYKKYVVNVRKEYASSPNFDAGRKRVMLYFLAMPRIFKTDFFHALYEDSARANIAWELGTLTVNKTRHIILISIDGFRPDFYLDSKWPAPNLQYLAKQGVSADGVDGIFPSVTYPSHTSIITGAYPTEHGIYYNSPFQPEGQTGIWNSETSLIRTETIWDATKKAGKVTASVSWPVSVGANIDYNIPEAFTLKNPLDRREPTSLYATPKGLFEEVQARATGQMEAIDLNINYSKMDENLGRITAYLFRTYRPALITLHLPGVDHAQHSEGRDGQSLKFAIANADRAVASILETVTLSGMLDSTAIIITGDHGFVDVKRSFSPNTLLANAGLLDAKEGAGRKWKAIFQASSGSAFLHLKDSNDKETLKIVTGLLAQLPDSVRSMYKIIDRKTLLASGADPHAFLALAATKGVSINGKAEGPLTGPGKGGAHGYYPDFAEIRTGFIGHGSGFGKNKTIHGMKLVDIAPIVAAMLQVPFSKKPDARIMQQCAE